jgi:hypothetical protein
MFGKASVKVLGGCIVLNIVKQRALVKLRLFVCHSAICYVTNRCRDIAILHSMAFARSEKHMI